MMIKYFKKLIQKANGFTLAEALIITVMTGFCLFPILGTMQNAQQRTENFDHQSKMQMYSRSRLNAEIANAAFDHKSVDVNDEYHYIIEFNKDGYEDNALLKEFPKTNIPLETLKIFKSNVSSLNQETKEKVLVFLECATDTSQMPYIDVIHAYKTSVETRETPPLEGLGIEVTDTTSSVNSPKSLLAIVVKTSLLESDGKKYNEANGKLRITRTTGELKEVVDDELIQVPPVSLFAFVNLPIISDDTIWVANAHSNVLHGVDPDSKILAVTINMPKKLNEDTEPDHFRPWHLALHPTQKILACQTEKYLYLINTDRKSNAYKEFSYACNSKAKPEVGKGGIAFRPDGKYLFVLTLEGEGANASFTMEANSIEYETFYDSAKKADILRWNAIGSEGNPATPMLHGPWGSRNLGTECIGGMVAGADGYLYVSAHIHAKDGNPEKHLIIRFPMYPTNFDDWNYEVFAVLSEKAKSIDVSPDGKKLFVVRDGCKGFDIFDTRDGRPIYYKDLVPDGDSVYKHPFKSVFVARSIASGTFYDDKNLSVFVSNDHEKEGIENILARSFYAVKTNPAQSLQNIAEVSDFNVKANDTQKVNGAYTLVSPDNNTVIINDKKRPVLYFVPSNVFVDTPIAELKEDDGTILPYVESNSNEQDDKNCTDMVTSKRDVLAVAHNTDVEGDKGEVELFELNTMLKYDVGSFTTTDPITSFAMNPQGDMLMAGHGYVEADGLGAGTPGFTRMHINDVATSSSIPGRFALKSVFDDRTPNMIFSMNAATSRNVNYQYAFSNLNALYGIMEDWIDTEGTYKRNDFKLDDHWKRLDIIGMPRGGAMVLYGKDDGSSMIEWIGRRQWKDDGSMYGKYKLFARWANIAKEDIISKLPPLDFYDITSNNLDASEGGVTLLINQKFAPGTIIDKIKYKPGDFSGTRYITILIVRALGDINNDGLYDYEIIDYTTNSIGIVRYDGNEKFANLNWKNGGKIIDNNCYVAFWNGNIKGSKNKGPIRFDSRTFDFISDYGDYDKQNSTPILSDASFIKPGAKIAHCSNGEVVSATGYTNYRRRYAIQFISSPSDVFPPLYSKKLAVAPDQSTLAVLSGTSVETSDATRPRLSLFDFNKNIYGPETQLEGMLVDYREPRCNRDYTIGDVSEIPYPFPYETGEALFKKVGDNFHINNSEIASFPSLTTKYGPYWSTFNEYPANMRVSGGASTEINYNKRFIGYVRPEFEAKKLQSFFSEDIRFFYNNSYQDGSIYDNVGSVFSSPLAIDLKSFDTGLLQIDQSFWADSAGLDLSVFLSKVESPSNFNRRNAGNGGNYYTSSNSDWEPLKSEYTYILRNQPSFMKSYILNASGIELDVDNTSMIYSRDKAKPVLFMMDKTDPAIWAFYNHRVLRIATSSTNINNTNLVISSDGQELVYGSKDKYIKSLDISNPEDANFLDVNEEGQDFNSATYTTSVTFVSDISSYTCEVASAPLLNYIPAFLATKPYNSFNSAKTGGEYKEITNSVFTKPESQGGYPQNQFMNGSMTVANGGIYIYNGSTKLLCYNPLTREAKVLSDPANTTTEILKTKSAYCPMTSYDDVLYIMGSDGTGSPNPGSMVQSYNVNTNEIKKSIYNLTYPNPKNAFNESYQVNLTPVDADNDRGPSNFYGNYNDTYSGVNVTNAYHAFNSDDSWSYSNDNNNDTCITITNPIPLTLNKIKISTRSEDYHDSWYNENYCALYDFTIDPNNGCTSFNMDSNPKVIDFTSPVKINNFSLSMVSCKCKTDNQIYTMSYNLQNNRHISVILIQLWRDGGVKRITPSLHSLNTTYKGKDSFAWSNSNIHSDSQYQKVKISCSSSKSGKNLSDIFVENSCNDNNIVEGSHGWENNDADSNPWIKVSLDIPEVFTAVRFSNDEEEGSRKCIEKIRCYGTNDDNIGSTFSSLDGWESISFSNGSAEFTAPRVADTFITAELEPNKRYKHFLFYVESFYGSSHKLRLKGFELYSKAPTASEPPISVPVNENYLSPLVTDDLGEVNVYSGACCSTPYGLVYSGGLDGTNATTTALLYWPHAVNKYDGTYHQYGICRKLPNMKNYRANHALVWHKGKIYAIGGCINSSGSSEQNSANSFIECLDYNNSMSWQYIPLSQLNFVGEANSSELFNRHSFGACSFRDEIFVFGGKFNGNNARRSGFAWNPETGIVRKLNYLPKIGSDSGRTYNIPLAPCAAVPFGSKIYIYGYDFDAPTGSGGPRMRMFEYTP